jgi:hypothetical protein
MEAFPITAAFALTCDRPVEAFMAAVQEYGRHAGNFLVDLAPKKIASYLTWWTGYETTDIDTVSAVIQPIAFMERRLNRLQALKKMDDQSINDLHPAFLHRLRSVSLSQEVFVQFTKHLNGKITFQKYDADLGELMVHVDRMRSVAEGLAELDTTMLCQQAQCPFHRFRVCGRVATLPDDFRNCKFKVQLEEMNMSPETLESLKY